MYASKRSIAKAQGGNGETSKNARINKLRHRGMQKDHLQITPDGKVIQHYKMDTRSAQFMKELKKAQEEAAAKKVENATEVTEEASVEVSE